MTEPAQATANGADPVDIEPNDGDAAVERRDDHDPRGSAPDETFSPDEGEEPDAEMLDTYEHPAVLVKTDPSSVQATRERAPDTWAVIKGQAVAGEPRQLIGAQPQRRSGFLVNRGTLDVYLGPTRDVLAIGDPSSFGLKLGAGEEHRFDHTGALWVQAVNGAATPQTVEGIVTFDSTIAQ
jgi:hypothetical protein